MELVVDLFQTETLNVPVPLDSTGKLAQKSSMPASAILVPTMANVKSKKRGDSRVNVLPGLKECDVKSMLMTV